MIRLISKRSGGSTPELDELVIDVDRSNPVLGNPYVLTNPDDSIERTRVIKQFQHDFDIDCANNGPMFKECQRIAGLLTSGKRVVLRCWCSPKPCHGDIILEKVREVSGVGILDFS